MCEGAYFSWGRREARSPTVPGRTLCMGWYSPRLYPTAWPYTLYGVVQSSSVPCLGPKIVPAVLIFPQALRQKSCIRSFTPRAPRKTCLKSSSLNSFPWSDEDHRHDFWPPSQVRRCPYLSPKAQKKNGLPHTLAHEQDILATRHISSIVCVARRHHLVVAVRRSTPQPQVVCPPVPKTGRSKRQAKAQQHAQAHAQQRQEQRVWKAAAKACAEVIPGTRKF